MNVLKFKKVMFGVVLVLIFSTAITLIVINHEINQFWGAHTEVVDSDRFKQPLKAIAVVGVNVLAVDGKEMIPQQTVLIKSGLIVNIGTEIDLPVDAQLIDGSGKYLIPGLIDSHVHLWQSPNDLLLYLANGVTHIRELNGSEAHLDWKAEIKAGRPGPDMFVASRRHNSQGLLKGWFDRWTAKINNVSDVDSVEANVESLVEQGFDAIKIYTFMNNSHFEAFNEVAKKLDVQILGHIPIDMKLSEIWQSEMKELAHIEELVKALDREFGGYDRLSTDDFLAYVESRSEAIINHLLQQDMAVVSTLTLMAGFAEQTIDATDILKTVELAYVNPGISEATHPAIRVMGWLPDVNIYRLPDDYPAHRVAGNNLYWQTYAKANQILLNHMAAAGVKVLAGTDANVPVMVPGFSMHDELESLTRAGMTEVQALLSATAIPAEWMKLKTGKIQTGHQVDLLLLEANPLDDINNTQSIHAVINNGVWYSRQQLDGMLKAVKHANDSSRNKDISAYME